MKDHLQAMPDAGTDRGSPASTTGIEESIARRDLPRAVALNRWFHALVTQYEDRLVPVDRAVAE